MTPCSLTHTFPGLSLWAQSVFSVSELLRYEPGVRCQGSMTRSPRGVPGVQTRRVPNLRWLSAHARENDSVALRNRQRARSRTKWLTAAFWIITLLFAYALLVLFGWWAWLMYLGAGSAVSYLWWKRRRRGRYAILFGSSCAVLVVMALAMIGWALLATFSVPVDSVGPRRVVCGSVINPVPADELRVTIAGSDELAGQSRPIPQSELERVCSNRLHDRGSRAAGLALIGLIMTVRAAGHFRTSRNLTIN